MKIAITDANIFIDIIYLEIHSLLPLIGFEIYTTQYVLNELDEDQIQKLQPIISNNVLIVYSFQENELEELSKFFIKEKSFSSRSFCNIRC